MSEQRRRTHPRVAAGFAARLRTAGGVDLENLRIENISLGGVFVEMDKPLGFGTEVSLEFALPTTPHRISCKGFVVWSRKVRDDKDDLPTGIGIRLMDIGVQDMRTIAEYVEGKLSKTSK